MIKVDIDLILTSKTYFMLLSYDPDILNRFLSYIKYYIRNQLYIHFLTMSIILLNKNYKNLCCYFVLFVLLLNLSPDSSVGRAVD